MSVHNHFEKITVAVLHANKNEDCQYRRYNNKSGYKARDMWQADS